MRQPSRSFLVGAIALALSGCSASSPGPFIGIPGAASVTPSSLTFTATGSAAAQTITAAEAGYSGSFAASTPASGQAHSCAGIATIASGTGSTFTVTPVAAGACAFTISGLAGQSSATLSVSVTTTSVSGS